MINKYVLTYFFATFLVPEIQSARMYNQVQIPGIWSTCSQIPEYMTSEHEDIKG